MTSFENLSITQKLRASVHRDVRAICTESLHLLGMEMTKPAMEIVAELVYRKLSLYGTDLEAFAKHAKRNTVNSEDVKLLVRRNPALKTHLNTTQPSNPLTKDKRRKTAASVTKQLTTPIAKPKGPPRPNSEGRQIEESDKIKDLGEGSKTLGTSRKELGEEREDFDETKNVSEDTSKGDDSFENRITNEVEHMSVEETIDLTFD